MEIGYIYLCIGGGSFPILITLGYPEFGSRACVIF
jgi:hypothetical protein